MNTQSMRRSTALLGLVLAAAVSAPAALAGNERFTVAIDVSTAGLDVGTPAGAQALYARLRYAAREVCGETVRAGLAPVDNPDACFEKSLANAVRQAGAPLVTQLYFATHTPEVASRWGMDPTEMLTRR